MGKIIVLEEMMTPFLPEICCKANSKIPTPTSFKSPTCSISSGLGWTIISTYIYVKKWSCLFYAFKQTTEYGLS